MRSSRMNWLWSNQAKSFCGVGLLLIYYRSKSPRSTSTKPHDHSSFQTVGRHRRNEASMVEFQIVWQERAKERFKWSEQCKERIDNGRCQEGEAKGIHKIGSRKWRWLGHMFTVSQPTFLLDYTTCFDGKDILWTFLSTEEARERERTLHLVQHRY